MQKPGLNDKKHLAFIGAKISEKRHALGIKIDTVALSVRVSKKVISQIENGRYHAIKELLLKKICDYLQIPLSELFVVQHGHRLYLHA